MQKVLLLLLAATFGAQEAVPQHDARKALANTWSATSTTGLTLMGTWTATADSKTGHVTGTWTLLDAQRRTVARGGWSATKASAEWTGHWRATRSPAVAPNIWLLERQRRPPGESTPGGPFSGRPCSAS